MKNLSTGSQIDVAVAALEEAIRKRKIEMHNAQSQIPHVAIIPHLFSGAIAQAGGSYGAINQALGQGREFAQNIIKEVQQNVEQKPWQALRRAASYGFAIGLFLSMRHKKSFKGEKE